MEIFGNAYGGGNAAGVINDTKLNIIAGIITTNVYGGGEEGVVYGSTNVNIADSVIQGSLYAGGNGNTAIVYGNTNVNIGGKTVVGTQDSVSPRSGCVFGGGNAAATGTETIENSTSTVNIVGATIYGNVYGGANTSIVYGYTNVNIGFDAVTNTSLSKSDIYIKGTIFGGGEANASGSEVYDFSFISVTKGIDININGTGHTIYKTEGSIFGSGNASSTSGKSNIYIKDFGDKYNPQNNVSIQRADTVTLDNSAMSLKGATDRTNEYSNEFFTISRVDEVILKNNSTLYLNYGANLLKKLSSIDNQGEKAVVTIDEDTGNTTRSVDNRIYMREGKNLNIATNEQVTAYGEVSGMIFLGLFTNTVSPHTSTGLYNHTFNNNDKITNEGTFSSNSYVLAMHMLNHDTTKDGFYTNHDEDGYIRTNYISTTPEDDLYYIWLVGEEMDVTTFEITLTASKYATLGTHELSLTGFSVANTKYTLTGFSAGLTNGISLIDKSEIASIAENESIANNVFGLSMRSGKNGWQADGLTSFYTQNGGSYSGSSIYSRDNSTFTPTLTFCLYHSENLTLEQMLGEVKIRLQVLTPLNDLEYKVSYIDINITMLTALYQDYYYESAISPGEEFELFTTTETNITNKSKLSTYYSLYIDNFSDTSYYDEYFDCHRVLVSRDSANKEYAFREGTKITMIDKVENKYYYYVVSSQDEALNKSIYKLSEFIEMGSDNQLFDERSAISSYYNSEQNLIYENYIFHVDFKESNLTTDIIDNTLLIQLQNEENQTLIGVLGIQRDTTKYGVYLNKDSRIDVQADVTPSVVYLGNKINLTVTTNFVQNIVSSKTIYDTVYFNNKMGVKISIFDNNDNKLSSDSLLGVKFILDGQVYYPRIDGTVRINIAQKVSNVLSKITIDTSNNTTLATGTYTIKVESFGSPDGICYGDESSDHAESIVTIINSAYGLNATTEDNLKIVDSTTGKTLNGNNSMVAFIKYSSRIIKSKTNYVT